MWPTSDRFDALMAAGHIPVRVSADLYVAGTKQLLAGNLQVLGGQVVVDRTSAIRRSCTVQLTDPDGSLTELIMGEGSNPPPAPELVLRRGVQYPDGTTEMIPLGVFGVSLREEDDAGSGTSLTLTGYDRSRAVQRAKLLTTYYVASGSKYVDAAVALVDNRLPFPVAVERMIETTQPTVTASTLVYHEQDDPWQHVRELAAAIGCEVYFDVNGALRVADVPNPADGLVSFEFADGVTSLLLSIRHSLEDEPGYNATIVTGEGSANETDIPRAIVVDNNPASPTYFYGPYGQVPEWYSDPQITTNAQALTAAAARFRRISGLTEVFTLAVVPHPALAPSDVIRVRRGPSELDYNLVVESFTFPLDVATAQTLVARRAVDL